jgi:Tfp pilus assembly protein PilE
VSLFILLAIGLMAVAILIVVAIPSVLAIIRVARRWSRDRAATELQAEASVVDKRTRITRGGAATDQRYYVTFQFATGSRLELEVSPSESGMLVVGDAGRLNWRGTRYLGFAREILR